MLEPRGLDWQQPLTEPPSAHLLQPMTAPGQPPPCSQQSFSVGVPHTPLPSRGRQVCCTSAPTVCSVCCTNTVRIECINGNRFRAIQVGSLGHAQNLDDCVIKLGHSIPAYSPGFNTSLLNSAATPSKRRRVCQVCQRWQSST